MSELETGRTLTDQVVDKIREGITTGRFRLDTHHSVQTFAKELGVSRTPVREALVRLADIGLIEFERNRGIKIVPPTVHGLEEIFQLRLAIEPFAAGRAADQVEPELIERLQIELRGMKEAVQKGWFTVFLDHDVGFHELMMRASGSERLVEIVHGLRDATRTVFAAPRLLQDATAEDGPAFGLRQSLADVMKDHEPILRAVEEKQQQAAATAMFEHIERTGGLMLEQLAEATGTAFNPAWAAGISMPNFE